MEILFLVPNYFKKNLKEVKAVKINYKKLSYTIKARFVKMQGDVPTGEKWNENLSAITLTENANPDAFSETFAAIINSFENLLGSSAYDPYDQQAILNVLELGEIATQIDEDPTYGITTDGDTVNFTLTLRTMNQLAENKTTKIAGYWRGDFDSDTVPLLDTFTRALTGLTTNTYKDVLISATLEPLKEV